MTQPEAEPVAFKPDADYYFRLEEIFEPPPVRPMLTEWQRAQADSATSP